MNRVPSFLLTVLLWLPPLDMSCLHVLKWKCACAKKKKKEALFNFIQSMICTICFLVVFSDYLKQTMYVPVSGKDKKRLWITFYHRTTKVEARLFLRKEVLEWLNPLLPDLLLDCLSCSHFNCTYRFYMNISPWIKRYDYEIATRTSLRIALSCLVIRVGLWYHFIEFESRI